MIHHLKRPEKNFKLAIILILIGDVMLALQAVCVKLASPYLTTNFLAFGRSAINLVLLIAWHLISHKKIDFPLLFKTNAWKYHAVRSLFGVGAIYCFYYGIKYLSLAPATILFFSFPLFIPLVSRVWLKVKLFHHLWWGIAIAFVGIIFVIDPGVGFFQPTAFIPLLGAILGAVAIVAMRCLHFTDPSERIMNYYFLTCVVVTAAVLFLTREWESQVWTGYSLLLGLGVGIFAALFQTFLTWAAKYAPVRFLSPFIYISFIFSALFDVFLWHAHLKLGLLIGFLLILGGTILMVFMYPKDDLSFKGKPSASEEE